VLVCKYLRYLRNVEKEFEKEIAISNDTHPAAGDTVLNCYLNNNVSYLSSVFLKWDLRSAYKAKGIFLEITAGANINFQWR
jgi:hypothetical protein